MTTTSEAREQAVGSSETFVAKTEGPAVAAMLAAGIGCLSLGVLTTVAMANAAVRGWLEWKDDVGPLSGMSGMAVIIWLVAWGLLHWRLRTTIPDIRRAVVVSLVLVGLGVLGTFPPFFQSFGPN